MSNYFDEEIGTTPTLILAHTDRAYVAQVSRAFRKRGWQVILAQSGSEGRRLAWEFMPTLVVLDTELFLESGWLTCNKLKMEHPDVPVVLVTPDPRVDDYTFADFVGAAALVDQADGAEALLQEASEEPVPLAG